MKEIEILQEKIAYQERTIETLNDALVNQQQQLNRLQEEVRALAGLMREWREEAQMLRGEQAITQEIPPHYWYTNANITQT